MRYVSVLAFVFLSISAALGETQTPKLESCEEQVKLFCPAENSPPEVVKCLLKHRTELSPDCKGGLERFLRANEQASEQEGGSLGGLAGINALTPPFPVISYDGRMHAKANSLSDERLKISTPISQSKEDYLALSLNGGWVHFGDAVTLSSGRTLATDFYRTELGAQYSHQLPEHKSFGIRGSVGYASDKLYQSIQDTTFTLSAQYGFPGSGPGYWMLTVFISNNSPFLNYIPIPGFLYLYRTSTFTGIFGFPVISMQWTPIRPWAFSLSAFGPAITAEVAYGAPKIAQIFTDFKWENQSFIPNQRDDSKDRLTIEQKNVSLGVRSLLLRGVLTELQFGYDFERMVYIGDKFRNTRGGVAQLDGGMFVGWSAKAAF